jgi:hypothetical protein
MRSGVRLACSVALSIGATVLAAQTAHRPTTALGEWPTYGGDLASSHYSPLDHIRKDNFATLRIAWRAITPDATLSMTLADGSEWTAGARAVFDELNRRDPKRWRDAQPPFINNFKATPLMVGGVLYLNTPLSIGAALDARTGAMRLVYNPKSYEAGTTSMTLRWNQRGVAYWTDGSTNRIFWGTGDGYLLSVDAKTGLPSPAWLWRERSDRSDAGAAACAPGRARLSQCADVLGPVSAARRGRHRHRASIDLVTREQEGADSRLDSRVRRTNGCAAMDLQDRACRGRVRLRNVAARHGRSERQGDGVDDDERR